MKAKLNLVITVLLFCLVAGQVSAEPNLLGRWNFDDGTANDISGNGHHGTIIGEADIVDDSERGKVLRIRSNYKSGVNCGGGASDCDWADITKSVTVAVWVKTKYFVGLNECIASKGDAFMIARDGSGNYLKFYNSTIGYHAGAVNGSKDIQDDKWHFIVFVYDRYTGARYLYIDAKIDSAGSCKQYLASNDYNFFIGSNDADPRFSWRGLIDDVRLYDRALSEREIRILYRGGFATEPNPTDTTGNVSTDVVLSWTPGRCGVSANRHDVYFGTDWYDVNKGIAEVHIGLQDGNSFDPKGLKAGTTYYWKVNEINNGRVQPGYIWSFRTETEGFYKDLFQDSALRLVETTEYPAAKLLALSYEHLTLIQGSNIPPEEQAIQDSLFIGNEYDDNGVLLYPDGEPRFRCIYVSGGGAGNHGRSLGEEGRQRVRDFYNNGGSYTGSCAGAFICSKGTSTKPVRETYFGIWPAQTFSFKGVFKVANKIPADSPLLNYYDFGGDFYIDDIQHWNGPSAIFGDPNFWHSGTEVCTIYDAPGKAADGHADIWAYKKNADTGRVVPIGSHPERMPFGEQRDLTAAVLRYAMDGQGSPNIKASLENGAARRMNDNKSSGREKIGDKQYHHFTIDVPEGTEQLTISMRGDDDVNDLNLFLKKGGFAFKGEDGVIEATNSAKPRESITVDNPQAGMWYVGVKGVSTVSVTKEEWGYKYTGNLAVLNGVSYSITAYIFPAGYKETVEGYYKDLFMDSGCRLTTYKHLPAATYLGLTMEYVALANKGSAEEEKAIQNKVIAGNEFDDNGVLLYPDGEPRFRFIYVNGGSATRHGKSLSEESRQRVRDFYNNGGSYSGSCAGAFISTEGTQKVKKKVYFELWPGRAHTTGLSKTRTGHFIPKDSPLLKYYDYGGDLYVDDVYHNGGCYIDEANSLHWAEDTEVLSRYDYGPNKIHKKVSTWALKKSDNTGRVVPIGSHPEGVTYGEQRDMMAAIFQYALDGVGSPNVKAALENGAARRMNDNKRSGYEKIGDKQYHHFTIDVAKRTKKLTITLDGDDTHNLDLFARKGDFAFRGKKGVITAANSSRADETINIDNPSAGLWYIAVKGVDTVETTKVSWGWQYCGNLEVLNGTAYTISAGW